MAKTTVIVVENGPNLVSGIGTYTDATGNEQSSFNAEKPVQMVALCRCGGSRNKPFCDGTHKENGFQAPGVKIAIESDN